jgi:diguanylate cyclase (GGDEF)-like protein
MSTGAFQAWTFSLLLFAIFGLGTSRLDLSRAPVLGLSLPWPVLAAIVFVVAVANDTSTPASNQTVHWYPLGALIGPLFLLMTPGQVVIGYAVGQIAVTLVQRQQRPPVKQFFNLASYMVTVVAVLAELQWLAGAARPGTTAALGLYLLLQLTFDVTTIINVRLVVAFYARSWSRRLWVTGGKLYPLGELVLCVMGATIMFVVKVNPLAALFIAVGIIWAAVLQSRSVGQDAERSRLIELHELGEMLLLGSDVSHNMADYVLRTSRLLSADFVEVIILGPTAARPGTPEQPAPVATAGGFTVTLDQASIVTTTAVGSFAGPERAFLTQIQSLGAATVGEALPPSVEGFLAGLGLREGFAIRLGDPDGMLGVLIVGNGAERSHRDAQRLLLGRNLAMQTTIALERSDLLAQIRAAVVEQERLLKRALTDSLTGIGNRDAFVDRLQAALEDGRSAAAPVGVLYIDLDGFKAVNDRLGHPAGDEVLKVVARRLEKAVRPQDVVTRPGGDEFAVVLVGISDEAAACAVAERVVLALATPVQVAGQAMARIGASVGVACSAANPAITAAELMAAADRAMYVAKREGPNQVRLIATGAKPVEEARAAA